MSDVGLNNQVLYTSAPAKPRWGRRPERRLGPLMALADIVTVAALVLACDTAYHALVYGGGLTMEGVRFALVAALTYSAINAVRGGYDLHRLAKRGAPEPGSGVGPLIWLAAWGIDLVILFVAGSGETLSRGLVLTSLAAGLAALPVLHRHQGALVRKAIAQGVRTRSLFLVGRRADLKSYLVRTAPDTKGVRLVGWFDLDANADDADALERLRALGADDVVIVLPWHETARIERLLSVFVQAPVAVHLAPDPSFQTIVERPLLAAGHAGVFEREPGLVGLPLVPRRSGSVRRALKRTIDLGGATAGLLLLAPLLAVLAVLVRLSGPGPVIYRQLRHGFNEGAFEIYKFRSMRTGDDTFRQATRGDDRITPIGRFMRRTNLDELPQLVNVLRGEMSLVGPRPHAAAHNDGLAGQIANYACRHHAKPGITGWAQVNGLRGETDDAAMRARVAMDLDYIRNWTPWMDLRIIWLTVFSRRAYKNAA